MRTNQLEELAANALAETRSQCPVDAFLVAESYGFSLTPVGAYEEGRHGLEIRFNARVAHREQQESVARFVARWLLEREGFYASDHAIARLSRALMLPLDHFVAYVGSHRGPGSFDRMMQRHVHASESMIGARVGDAASAQRRQDAVTA